jgi:uncharacterized protein (DUF488 family)
VSQKNSENPAAVHNRLRTGKARRSARELKRTKIELLVDTRAVAASRRPGFSKRQLAASLDEAGIGYIHLQKLGTPAQGRATAQMRCGAFTTSTSRLRKHKQRSMS